jgi:hypothetical protein
VYKRCADASIDAVQGLQHVEWMEPYLKNITDGLSTVSSMSDEIAHNTIASVDLTMRFRHSIPVGT